MKIDARGLRSCRALHRAHSGLYVFCVILVLGGGSPVRADADDSGYLGVTWGTKCSQAVTQLEARGFAFKPLLRAAQSPLPPHAFESPRGAPVCTPSEADEFLDGASSYEVAAGKVNSMSVEVLCRNSRFVGIVNRLNRNFTEEYVCLQRAAGSVSKQLTVADRTIEEREPKHQGVRYFELVEGSDVVSYTVLWRVEDERVRAAQRACARKKFRE